MPLHPFNKETKVGFFLCRASFTRRPIARSLPYLQNVPRRPSSPRASKQPVPPPRRVVAVAEGEDATDGRGRSNLDSVRILTDATHAHAHAAHRRHSPTTTTVNARLNRTHHGHHHHHRRSSTNESNSALSRSVENWLFAIASMLSRFEKYNCLAI